MWDFRPSPLQVATLLALFAGLPVARAQTALPESPFLNAGTPAAGRPEGPIEPFQLTGISVVGDKTFVSIYETAEKHSHWIAVGGSAGDIHVLSCDVAGDQSVVRIGGKVKVLTLRTPAVTSGPVPSLTADSASAAAGAPTNGTGASPAATSSSDEEQAREARMLVTDLLEISMQQRKAYEDAQKKAADQTEKP